MKWTNLPPMNALRAFAALAECGSYTAAGQALNVTHAAVMQQVRALETFLDVELVTRSGRSISLTDEGAALARHLESGFHQIRRGVDELTDVGLARPVMVTMSPAFAVKWLMPRLADFQTAHPEITLLLNPTGRFLELKPGETDIALRYSRQESLPDGADVLVSGDLAIVGTPDLMDESIQRPSDLTRLPWLQELGTNEVAEVLGRHGVHPLRSPQILHMPGNLIMDAVQRGDGITYTLTRWVQDDLEAGRLVARFIEPNVGNFYIETRPGAARPPLRSFIRWLKRQAD
ncbi:LysR family transcriptional regulator [Shimia sediminis]|uniref:LysR family transcriptional regulator n=1 Tax=Shimia sediminis TaxID=2497945 RepID=UPI000F8E9652|nr:LysR family transcriptional regulator [Shimia sediminis]